MGAGRRRSASVSRRIGSLAGRRDFGRHQRRDVVTGRQRLVDHASLARRRHPSDRRHRVRRRAFGRTCRHADSSLSRQHAATTVATPLGRWTSFAAVGTSSGSTDQHSWSTDEARTQGRQRLQVKVLALTRPCVGARARSARTVESSASATSGGRTRAIQDAYLTLIA
jgi:hypothetical protein